MTPTVLETDRLLSWPESGSPGRQEVAAGNESSEWLTGVSGFVADTWVFFSEPQDHSTGTQQWGLGFGPADVPLPRWSLFHCVTEDRFDARSICPALIPSNLDLLRWSTSVVGPATATLLLDAVGSSFAFYRQYFAERPDLRGDRSTLRLGRPLHQQGG